MGKKLMPGKDPKAKRTGKTVSHGNSHVSADLVKWDEKAHKWVLRNKEN